jgi:hypothetical protein
MTRKLRLASWLTLMAAFMICVAPGPWSPERAAGADDPPPEGFRFPGDKGGQLLQMLLTPGDKQRMVTPTSTPRPFPPLRSLEQPEVPLLPSQAPTVTLPPAKLGPGLKPGHPSEEPPLTSARARPAPPESLTLPTGPLVFTPSAPVEKPAPVPVLARPVPDRAALEDPSRDASLAASLAATPPDRPGPAPFLRFSAPDPFENRETVKLQSIPAESSLPVSAAPKPPKP